MEVRAAVLDNLTLFDDPPETWESESLAHLDSALYARVRPPATTDGIRLRSKVLAPVPGGAAATWASPSASP